MMFPRLVLKPYYRTFLLPLIPAVIGGAIWDAVGLPLGWLMGAAFVVGLLAMSGRSVSMPRPIQNLALTIVGGSVGLSLTPNAVLELARWAPVMLASALIGILLAVLAAPVLAKFGRVSPVTAFFSLLPGGVMEMANIGDRFGANASVISALHALRVAMIVSLIPLAVFAFSSAPSVSVETVEMATGTMLAGILLVGAFGGWLATKAGVPAGYLLGAVVLVGGLSGANIVSGAMPTEFTMCAQVMIGFALGAKFKRETMLAIVRVIGVAIPVLATIMGTMALIGFAMMWLIPETATTLILCFSIGGMAEMVLTAKALGQNAAIVAAFQMVRGVVVNTIAGAVWGHVSKYSLFKSTKEDLP